MTVDLFHKCASFTRAAEVKREGIYAYYRPLETEQSTEVVVSGRKMLMAGSNNYLGLANDPRVKEAAMAAIRDYGTGSTGSRLLNGNLDIQMRLERELAAFVGKPAALVFATGFLTNLGFISCIVGRHDVVVADQLDHASIIDGCRLALGKMKRFAHNDTESLDRTLASCDGNGGILIVVDGVFSMEGDIAPLPAIVPLARRYHARLMVDEAHSLGVFGENGSGITEHFHLTDQVDVIMGTFSKSLASMGGFVACSADVIEYIKHFSRPQIFTAGLSPADVAAALRALDIIKTEPERRKRLWENTRELAAGFKRAGFDIGLTQSPVIPVLVGDDTLALKMWRLLDDEGVFVNAIVPPAVPPGRALIRVSCMATHTRAQLARLLEAFEKAGKKLGII